MKKRLFLIVLDSMGIGEMPDAHLWKDEGSNTLGAIRNHPAFDCPNLTKLGLFNIEGVGGGVEKPLGCFARMTEASMGKDTTIGHWEIAGIVSPKPLPTYPNGFPAEIIEKLEALTGRKCICNLPYSGTEVIKDYGEEHLRTGALIVYTSADSVLQIAAHESVVPLPELYRYCELARELMQGEHGVGRVIARPFAEEWPFKRTSGRHDYSLLPPSDTMIDRLKMAGYPTIPIGKIYDIFAGKGLDECNRTVSNDDGMEKTIALLDRDFEGLCFVNLVDFDMVYGHRNDVEGYAKAMTAFDRQLGTFLEKMKEDDLLLITADHGCDPATPSTDHSREYTPMILYGKKLRQGVDLGVRPTFADISATVLDYFGADKGDTVGESFLSDCLPTDGKALLCAAIEARKFAYAPYSGFFVGAALSAESGKLYTGCNIESASYTPTCCAERTALFKAVSEGERKFRALAVVGGLGNDLSPLCAPCGVCRQMLREFCAPDMPVFLGMPDAPIQTTLGELLPYSFTAEDLAK